MINSEKSLIILTLDAGGTNFVFTAIKSGNELGEPIVIPAQSESQNACSAAIIHGFELLKNQLNETISAISFAFPGPADYPYGIIGDLPNFAGINGNYPLKQILESHFNIPVFINNDGNLFTYGEAIAGVLPMVNKKLEKNKAGKNFKNLIGLTLGTGFGSGIVINGNLLNGDNSCAAEIHNLINPNNTEHNIEQNVSTKSIQKNYAKLSNIAIEYSLMPEDIYKIAKGNKNGNQNNAVQCFNDYGTALGHAITNILTLIDGLVVIGGGISSAWDLFSQSMYDSLRQPYQNDEGKFSPRTTVQVFDLENMASFEKFINGDIAKINSNYFNKEITYDRLPRTGVILSKNGASRSITLGAYFIALAQLGKFD